MNKPKWEDIDGVHIAKILDGLFTVWVFKNESGWVSAMNDRRTKPISDSLEDAKLRALGLVKAKLEIAKYEVMDLERQVS